MKTKFFLIAISLFSFTGFVQAESKCVSKCSRKSATACETECPSKATTSKEKCAKKCNSKKITKKKKCDSECHAVKVTRYKVSGMKCGGCSKKLTKALTAVKGVEVKKICHKSGCVDVVIGEGTTSKQVENIITKSGFKITPAQDKKEG